MPIGRDRRHRLAVTAIALLSTVFALLTSSPSYAGPGEDHGTVAVVAAQGQAPGCGKGTSDDDRGAHPATPPRGGASYELLPAPHQVAWSPPVRPATVRSATPDRGPPPLDPPSPMDLSVLRV